MRTGKTVAVLCGQHGTPGYQRFSWVWTTHHRFCLLDAGTIRKA